MTTVERATAVLGLILPLWAGVFYLGQMDKAAEERDRQIDSMRVDLKGAITLMASVKETTTVQQYRIDALEKHYASNFTSDFETSWDNPSTGFTGRRNPGAKEASRQSHR